MSVLKTWSDDFQKFSPGISVYLHHGSRDKRLPALEEWRRTFASGRKKFLSAVPREDKKSSHIHVVLTTYEIVIKDLTHLKKQNNGPYMWGYLVV
jgi:SNF2 family DNA or RNA helicase